MRHSMEGSRPGCRRMLGAGLSEETNGDTPGFSRPALRIVITGGSSGIGYHIVETFALEGHFVFFTYLMNQKDADNLVKRFSPRVCATQLDQGRFDSVCNFAHQVRQWCGRHGIDVLINNAALGTATVVDYVNRTHDWKEYSMLKSNYKDCIEHKDLRYAIEDDAMMRVNALGPLWVTQQLTSLLEMEGTKENGGESRRGVIVFIGSVGGGGPVPFPEHRPADGMGKAASCQLAKHVAAQHVHDHIDVFCLNPGATDTKMFAKSTLDKLEDKASFVEQMPKKKLIRPQQIASIVFWLATSADSSVLHGGIIDASMGLGVRPGLQTEMNTRITRYSEPIN